MANLLSMSVSTYFAAQYLQYSYLDVKGHPIRDLVSFPEFLDLAIRDSTVGLLGGPLTGALGFLGYLLVLFPIGGFALGGYVLFSKLQLRPFGDNCEICLEPDWGDSRYAYTDDEMNQLFGTLKKLYRQGTIGEAVAFFMKWGQDVPPRSCRTAGRDAPRGVGQPLPGSGTSRC